MVLEDKLRKLEEACKQREAQRVSLELELTEVQESLRKALAGGVTLGLAIEPRPGAASPQVMVASAPPKGVSRANGLLYKVAAHPPASAQTRAHILASGTDLTGLEGRWP